MTRRSRPRCARSLPSILPQVAQWGALQSITFRDVDAGGRDVYDVVFAHAKAVWHIGPLTADGKVACAASS